MNSPARTTTPSRSLILLLGALIAFAPLSTDIYLPSLPTIGRELGVGTAAAQATMAIYFAGLAVCQFIYGPLSDRVGRRPLILIGLVIYLLGSVVCALAPSMNIMLLGRLLQAFGAGAGMVITAAVVGDLFDSTQTAKVMNMLVPVMGLSPILAPAIGSGILLFGGWRVIFWALCAFTMLVLLRTYFSLRETRSAETSLQAAQENPFKSYLLLFLNARLVGYLLVNALISGMLFAYISGSPALLIQTYGFSPQAYSGLLGINSIGIIVGAVFSSTIVVKFGIDRILIWSIGVAFVFVLLLFGFAVTGIGGHWIILVMLFLALSTFGVTSSNAIAGALSTDPLRAGSISALMNGAPYVSAGVTAGLTGVLWDHTARPMTGVMLGCVLVAAAALWLLVLRNKDATAH